MKKILSIFIGLLLAWFATSYAFQEKTEQLFVDFIEQYNQRMMDDSLAIKLNYYQKGFLSSDVEIELHVTDADLRDYVGRFVTLPIRLKYRIQHGPIIFDGQSLSLSKAHLTNVVYIPDLIVDSHRDMFVSLLGKDWHITSETTVGLENDIHISVNTDHIIHQSVDENGRVIDLIVTPFQFQLWGNANDDLTNFNTKLNLGYFDLLDSDKFHFYIGDLVVNNIVRNSPDVNQPLFNSQMTIQSAGLELSSLPFPIRFSASTASALTENQGRFDATDDIRLNFKDLTKAPSKSFPIDVRASSHLSGISREGMRVLKKFNNLSQVSPDKEKVEQYIQDWLNQLLTASNFDYQLELSAKDNRYPDKVASKALFSLKYTGQKYAKHTLSKTLKSFSEYLDKVLEVGVNATLHKHWIDTFNPKDKSLVEQFLAKLVSKQVFIENASEYWMRISYQKGKLIINGRDFSSKLQHSLTEGLKH